MNSAQKTWLRYSALRRATHERAAASYARMRRFTRPGAAECTAARACEGWPARATSMADIPKIYSASSPAHTLQTKTSATPARPTPAGQRARLRAWAVYFRTAPRPVSPELPRSQRTRKQVAEFGAIGLDLCQTWTKPVPNPAQLDLRRAPNVPNSLIGETGLRPDTPSAPACAARVVRLASCVRAARRAGRFLSELKPKKCA